MARAKNEQATGVERHINRLPLWVDDLLAMIAESGEPTLATGARLRLWLVICRRGGVIRADNSSLAKLSGLTLKQWKSVQGFILPGWEYDEVTQTYSVRRIVQEIERTGNKSAKAKASAEKRWMRTQCERNAKASCDGNANAMLSPAPAPSSSPAPKDSPSPHAVITPEKEPREEESQGREVTHINSKDGKKNTQNKTGPGFGMKPIGQIAGKVQTVNKPPDQETEAFLAERFPEVSEVGRKSLLNAGLTLQGAREVDAIRYKVESDPSKRPKDPGALWFTYLKAKTGTAEAAHA
jgi:uncharacterized protein YdaU (DUF1376 family)